MQLKIYGISSTSLFRPIILDCVQFVLNKFVPKKKQKNLILSIYIKSGYMKKTGFYGRMLVSENTPNSISIHINKSNNILHILSFLCHELVHVKQAVLNEWEFSNDDKDIETDDDIYYNSPWEIEAYGRERGLLKLWIEHTKIITTDQKNQFRRKVYKPL